MKGTEVIALFEKHGLSAHSIVSAVYNGMYPDYFGTRLKPFNCLTCEHAEPDRRQLYDPGACRPSAPRHLVAGISYCPHTFGGEPNAMVPEDGVQGTCKYHYTAMRDADFFERLKDCEFVSREVEEYLDDILPGRHRTPISPRLAEVLPPTTEPGHDQQADGYSRPLPDDEVTDFIQRLRDKKVHPDEIQYRVCEYQRPKWDLSQWQVHCLVNDIPYPPEGSKGEVERNKYGKSYGRARGRYLVRVETSEKSEKVPE